MYEITDTERLRQFADKANISGQDFLCFNVVEGQELSRLLTTAATELEMIRSTAKTCESTETI